MSKAKYSYLAGILDGEGCLAIGAGRRPTGVINYNPLILVSNTNKALIDWLQLKFGGQVYLSKKETDRQKAAWMWRITKKKNIELLLLAVLPYLIVKKEQAKVLLAFVRLTPEMNSNLRAEYWQQLRILNFRGVSVETNTQEASQEVKIESELVSDDESEPVVTQVS